MRDEISVIAGGVAGTAAIFVVLFAADVLTGYQVRSFSALAAFVSAQSIPVVGFLLFAALGVFAWPLFFLSFLEFLPGGTDVRRGAVFAIPLWVGYDVLFVGSVGGAVIVFLLVTLLGHLAYGAVMGWVYGRLGDHTFGGSS